MRSGALPCALRTYVAIDDSLTIFIFDLDLLAIWILGGAAVLADGYTMDVFEKEQQHAAA